jgi:hypothetical protein
MKKSRSNEPGLWDDRVAGVVASDNDNQISGDIQARPPERIPDLTFEFLEDGTVNLQQCMGGETQYVCLHRSQLRLLCEAAGLISDGQVPFPIPSTRRRLERLRERTASLWMDLPQFDLADHAERLVDELDDLLADLFEDPDDCQPTGQ